MYTGSRKTVQVSLAAKRNRHTERETHRTLGGRELGGWDGHPLWAPRMKQAALRPAVSTGALPGAPRIAGANATLPSN